MARTKSDGNGRLEEAITLLIQTQASFLARVSEIDARMAETNRINSERFARIEALLLDHGRILAEHSRILAEHTRLLSDHTRILQAMPETIREKIGFQTPKPPA